jgi:hypothetical protein
MLALSFQSFLSGVTYEVDSAHVKPDNGAPFAADALSGEARGGLKQSKRRRFYTQPHRPEQHPT